MKRLGLVIFFILLIFMYQKNRVVKPVFEDDYKEGFRIFTLKLNDIDLDNYAYIFKNINDEEYKITDFKFVNNYNSNIKSKLKKIKIEGGNYIDALTEYSNKYADILDDYEIESEISKIKTGNMFISEIKLYTTDITYNKLKKMHTHLKFSI